MSKERFTHERQHITWQSLSFGVNKMSVERQKGCQISVGSCAMNCIHEMEHLHTSWLMYISCNIKICLYICRKPTPNMTCTLKVCMNMQCIWIWTPQSAHYNYNWQPSSVTKQQFVYHYSLGSRLFLSYFYIAGISHHLSLTAIPYCYIVGMVNLRRGHASVSQLSLLQPCWRRLVVTCLSINVKDKIKLSSDTHLLYYNLDTAAQT